MSAWMAMDRFWVDAVTVLAVLLAALMSTISAMINVTSSVVINDFIKRYFAREMPQKRLVRLGQAASVAAVLIGFVFSLSFSNIVTAWETMVFVVVTVILVPATLRWHYWRFGAKAFVNNWSKAGPAHHCAVGVGHIARKIEKNTMPSANAMARMDCTRIFGAAPGLRPTASEAFAPIIPTAMAAAKQATAMWRLPVTSASIGMNISFLSACSAVAAIEHGPAAEICRASAAPRDVPRRVCR
jgi:hypothetical protein